MTCSPLTSSPTSPRRALKPAAIAGTDRLSRLEKLRVVYGPPIATGDLAGLATSEAAQTATDRLRDEILALEQTLK